MLIVLATYAGVLTADFVMWDDDISIYKNPGLGGLSPERIYWAFTDVASTMKYIPLTLVAWSAVYSLFGLAPVGYHLAGWIIHGLNAAVLFFVVRKILQLYDRDKASDTTIAGRQIRLNVSAAAAALVWALHPLRGDVVAQATNLGYCLSMFFILLSTLFYLKAFAAGNQGNNRTMLFVSVLFYVFSLLSYPLGIACFLIYFILDFYLLKRTGDEAGWWRTRAARGVLLEKLYFAVPSFLIAALTTAVRIKSAGVWQPPVPLSQFGLIDRFMQAMYILSYYVWRPFYPAGLSPIYTTLVSFQPFSEPFVFSALFFVAAAAAVVYAGRRAPLASAVFFSYIAMVFPFLGLFEHPHYPADRYSLLPSVCLSVLISFLIFLPRGKAFYKLALSASVAVIVLLAGLTVNHIKNWRNSETFFSHIIKTLGNDPYRQDIYWRLGKYLYEKNRKNEAAAAFEKTLAINPYHATAHTYLAQIAFENNDTAKEAFHLRQLLIADPGDQAVRAMLSRLEEKAAKGPAGK